MSFLRAITRFFLSLNTAFGLFLSFMAVAFVGSLSLVKNLAFFSGIDETPLFKWLYQAGDIRAIWWIYILTGTIAVLAVSIIFCTTEALLKRLSGKNLILKLSPQVIHVGVLFIMLGHLLTASMGFKMDLLINKGEKKVVDNMTVSVKDIKIDMDENGYYKDWEARLSWSEAGNKTHEKIIKPVHPVYIGQFGFYIKSVAMEPEASVLLRVCRDPGALWALIGGFLLSAGGLGFLYGRFEV